MRVIEKRTYKKGHPYFKILDELCFKSKNLYNATLYAVRQHYFSTGNYLSYAEVNKEFTDHDQADYRALPAKVSKLVQQLVASNFKSFFGLLKKKQNGKYAKPVHIPKYLDKVRGRQVVTYTEQALLKKEAGYVGVSGVDLSIMKFPVEDNSKIQFVRVVPKGYYIDVEIGKIVEEPKVKKNNRYASIDLGLSNLATITSNVTKPFIINGKPLKSVNQYYNKKKSKLQEIQSRQTPKKNLTNRMQKITWKRNNKIMDYLHKASRIVVNHLVSNDISLLVVGYNKGWKQDIAIGKQNNQNFVSIPFLKFVNMLKYKCSLVGIQVILNEESYTSKCSFLDNEDIKRHKEYQGTRIHRGLYRTKNSNLINADVNGSYNIMKKYLTKKGVWNELLYSDCIEVCSTPSVITVNL